MHFRSVEYNLRFRREQEGESTTKTGGWLGEESAMKFKLSLIHRCRGEGNRREIAISWLINGSEEGHEEGNDTRDTFR